MYSNVPYHSNYYSINFTALVSILYKYNLIINDNIEKTLIASLQ